MSELSAAFVRSAGPGRYCDGDCLWLLVKPNLSRYWAFRYKPAGGKLREMGLGRAGEGRNEIRLSEAREKATDLYKKVKAGVDPLAERDAAKAAGKAIQQDTKAKSVTFREAANRYIATHKAAWRNAKHAAQWTSTIETYACPIFGSIPVGGIETSHVLAALEPIWHVKPETASRVRGRVEVILDFAKTRGWRTGDNPAQWKGHLALALPARSKVRAVKHHAALPWQGINAFMRELKKQQGFGAACLRFSILTAARSGEARGARWSEIDANAKAWTIPAARMKAKREHRVPLSDSAMAVLAEMFELRVTTDADALVFPGADGQRPLSDMTLTACLRRMNREDLTCHGFRSTFRDWAAESTAYPGDVVEMALAHAIGSKVEAAYRRGDLFEKRIRLMADWGGACSAPSSSKGTNIFALKEASDAG
ncbi:tyrosine-type recombinase/integrase [Bosea sp. NBC_00550]|uniref:tyrosine-type recombinase/integrase n=1 Tax=Bosea sp. NBC_00550 TaxID=2969621 RepID=UPI0029FF14F5|nr:tyrosine-type recombinase/integrase [Bosea sp. NBC_00550]